MMFKEESNINMQVLCIRILLEFGILFSFLWNVFEKLVARMKIFCAR